MPKSNLQVSDLFVSYQGEGPRVGWPSVFVRTRACNLQCTWCDTKYTWSPADPGWSDYTVQDIESLAEKILRHARQPVPEDMYGAWVGAGLTAHGPRPTNLVLTGGEPLLWAEPLAGLLQLMVMGGEVESVEVETNGTIPPPFDPELARRLQLQYNVSPKLPGAGNETLDPWRTEVLEAFIASQRALFKLVVSAHDNGSDVEERVDWLLNKGAERERVYLMPEGTTPEGLGINERGVRHLAAALGIQSTGRPHVFAFGGKRAT